MANVTINDIKPGRASIAAFLATFPILGNVHTRRRRILNRADYVKKLGVLVDAVDGRQIVRYCELEVLKFDDSPDEGDDDCPVAVITFGIHLFGEYFDGTDAVNSTDDHLEAILTLRNAFLNTRNFAGGNYQVETQPITQRDFTQFGNDAFVDAQGHITDLTLIANFYD